MRIRGLLLRVGGEGNGMRARNEEEGREGRNRKGKRGEWVGGIASTTLGG